MHDTRHGLETDIDDLTAGTHGSMTASAANGFGQVQYDPAGTSCINLPYDFHPMYSTSSEKTRPTWTGHALNVSIADEIGHFDYCTSISNKTGSCTGKEGPATDRSPHDADDNFCFPASSSPLVKIAGCTDSNVGFDGPSYQPVWPDGGASHPAPWIFGAPKTGASFTTNYSRLAFEADLPLIEDHSFSPGNDCNDETGGGCVVPPLADNGAPAAFYPFWSTTSGFGDACDLVLGSDIPGHTVSDFGGVHQYGALLAPLYLDYGGQGAATQLFSDNRQVLSDNPCTR